MLLPEFIVPVFTKTSPKRSFLLTENERFGLFLRENWVYKFGHRTLEIEFFILPSSFLRRIPVYAKKKRQIISAFHVIRRCPPNKYIYLIVRLINGAPMPPPPLVIAHRKRKNPQNLI
jgi:hypothetical protein